MELPKDDQQIRVVLIAGLLNTIIQNNNSDDKSMQSVHFFDGEVQLEREGDMAVNIETDKSLYDIIRAIIQKNYVDEWKHFQKNENVDSFKEHPFLHLHRLALLLKQSDRPYQYEEAEKFLLIQE